ncbi:hypothetical protein FOMA001_g18719 [Fusarium oxysporum f. sp. matthiolae]|nr:hypothetical protein FOMA001_g18719 [Fusarium oxysporum f. sp. matthiolae]
MDKKLAKAIRCAGSDEAPREAQAPTRPSPIPRTCVLFSAPSTVRIVQRRTSFDHFARRTPDVPELT